MKAIAVVNSAFTRPDGQMRVQFRVSLNQPDVAGFTAGADVDFGAAAAVILLAIKNQVKDILGSQGFSLQVADIVVFGGPG